MWCSDSWYTSPRNLHEENWVIVEIFLLLLSDGFSINIFVSDQSMMLVHLASELWKNSFAPRFTMRGHLQFLCRFLFTLFLLNKSEWIPGINWLQLTSSLVGTLFDSVWSVLFGESVRHLPKRVSHTLSLSLTHKHTHTVPKQLELDSVCITLCVCVCARAREKERERWERNEWSASENW